MLTYATPEAIYGPIYGPLYGIIILIKTLLGAVASQTGWQGPKKVMLAAHLPQAYLTHLNGWQGQGG